MWVGFSNTCAWSVGRPGTPPRPTPAISNRFVAESGAQRSAEVTAHDVRAFAARLHAAGLSPRSIARYLSSVRGLFAFLVGRREINANPAIGIRAPKQRQRLPKDLGCGPDLEAVHGPG